MAKLGKNQKISERLSELEEELRNTKYNKRTQAAVGLLKAKIARLKDKQTQHSSKKLKSDGYAVKKSGNATAILVGFPSVGKSTLLNSLTNADSETGAYSFTTLSVIPGLLKYKHAQIQILDVPGIVRGAASGKGKGKEVLAVANNANLVIILIDVYHPEHFEIVKKELYESNIRLDQKRPDVKIKKKIKGGISIGATVKLTKLDKETINNILREYKITNADIIIRTDIDADELIDIIEGNKFYIPSLIILNKIDLIKKEKLEKIKKQIKPDLCISASNKENLEKLKELIFQSLNLIRVYCKEAGKPADLNEPLILFKDATLKDMCRKLHKEFIQKFKFARIWGDSVKYDNQKILKLKHKLKDNDIVEIHIS